MKKMIFSIVVFLAFITFVNADCDYGNPSPPINYNGSWAYGKRVQLTTSASSCLAENAHVYFQRVGDYMPTFSFYIDAILMEDDEAPNEDDPVKSYYGHNDGNGISWYGPETLDNGNLDSVGDNVCELYVKFRITPKLSGNNSQYFEDGLVRYTICMD